MIEPVKFDNKIDLNAAPTAACLQATRYFDSDDASVQAYAAKVVGDAQTDVEKVIKLYYAVRDEFRYDPRHFLLTKKQFCCRQILLDQRGFCMPKAVLLSTLARALAIPSGIGFAHVLNHLMPDSLLDEAGNNAPIFHGYSVLYVDGKWLKASPAFNLSMCEKLDTKPLEFDGKTHALFHEYDNQNRRHMEYIKDHGAVPDFPYETVYYGVFGDKYPDVHTLNNDE
ncbi:MAG: transglutaminase family protein [Pseudomonadales bacterium]|nr:transglutaminase family protein [Pseudomonadales bacterium]